MKICLRAAVLALLLNITASSIAQNNYNQYVKPLLGTGGHGHTFPGAVLPFGMVQLSPDTRVDGSWDGCSGYHYSDSIIYGFSHTHLSGTGCSDWGDILIMPSTSAERSMDNKLYSSPFSRATERASPGYYEVKLAKNNVKAELTTTLRVGIHRYTFPAEEASLLIDLLHRDKTLDCNLRVIDSVTVVGYRVSYAWAREQHVYFAMKLSKPFKSILYANKKQVKEKPGANEKAEGAYFEFDQRDLKPLMVKVAISPVSEEGALKNLAAEAPHWDFAKYRQEAEGAWNKQLSKIEVTSPDRNLMTIFYTALYHCCIHPSLNMDVDSQYRGRDNKIHTAQDFTNYSVFSLWDTYRALNPLFTIIEPKRTNDFINTFLVQYQQSGRLPMWELSGNETDCMIAFHSVSVIADAMAKGINGFDASLAYEAMKAASNYTAYGIPIFNKNGFLQVDDESESVSKTLEYGYDNWCIAQVAQLLNKTGDVKLFSKRSLAYYYLFDASTGCMRPRRNGNWLTPFYPAEINNHFTEGNSWQYSFYVPHDVSGLIKLHGGKNNFEKKLDELFTTSEKNHGRDQADVTGLIGQYAHGNEPSHHMAYLYSYVGKPQKSIERVRQICRDFYRDAPDGLIGNEDCGQMSAWYVFSSMGLYPVCPGQPQYVLGAPLFSNIQIHLENGSTFSITTNDPGKGIITGVQLNDKASNQSAITHSFITSGGHLHFISSPQAAATAYGTGNAMPASLSMNYAIVPSPVIRAASRIFKDKTDISIQPVNFGGRFVYTLDGSEPTRSSQVYSKPFVIDSSCTIKTRVYSSSDSSHVTTAVLHKIRYNYQLTLISKTNPQYSAEGPLSLTDGIYGSTDWRKGDWLGVQEHDFECLVDLGHEKELSYLAFNCLQDTRAWIVLPAQVSFYASNDNKNFTLITKIDNPVKARDYTVQTHKFVQQLDKPVKAKFIKVVAHNFGKLPEWHEGSGGDAFIFADELEIR